MGNNVDIGEFSKLSKHPEPVLLKFVDLQDLLQRLSVKPVDVAEMALLAITNAQELDRMRELVELCIRDLPKHPDLPERQ